MNSGDIVLIDLGISKMYLQLAEIIPPDRSSGLTIKYINRMDVQVIQGKDPVSGAPTVDTMWMRIGNTIGMSRTAPSILVLPKSACYHIMAIDKESKEYKDLITEFNTMSK